MGPGVVSNCPEVQCATRFRDARFVGKSIHQIIGPDRLADVEVGIRRLKQDRAITWSETPKVDRELRLVVPNGPRQIETSARRERSNATTNATRETTLNHLPAEGRVEEGAPDPLGVEPSEPGQVTVEDSRSSPTRAELVEYRQN